MVAVLQGLLLVIILIGRQKNQNANQLLAAYVFIVFLQVFVKTFESKSFYLTFPFLYLLPYCFYFLLGPTLYFYIKRLTVQGFSFRKVHMLHLIPFIIILAYDLPFMVMGPDEKFAYWIKPGVYTNEQWDVMSAVVVEVQGLVYGLLSLRRLNLFEKQWQDSGKTLDRIRMGRLKHLVIYLTIFWAVSLPFEICAYYFPGEWLNWFYWYNPMFFAFIALVYLISFVAISQPEIVFKEMRPLPEKIDQAKSTKSAYSKSGMSDDAAYELTQRLLNYMQKDKPYLDPELSIPIICEQLKISRHNLSQVLNTQLHKNFYSFINEFRVEETIQLLNDSKNQKKSLLQIALMAGFNSKASFNRAFKSILGVPPSRYKMNIVNESEVRKLEYA